MNLLSFMTCDSYNLVILIKLFSVNFILTEKKLLVVVVVVVVVFPSTIWRTVTLGSRNKAASQLSKLSALDNNLFSVKSRPYLSRNGPAFTYKAASQLSKFPAPDKNLFSVQPRPYLPVQISHSASKSNAPPNLNFNKTLIRRTWWMLRTLISPTDSAYLANSLFLNSYWGPVGGTNISFCNKSKRSSGFEQN